jgi:hypothetical protein
MASDTTDPSMKPIEDARIAERSTNRRLSAGQNVFPLPLAAVDAGSATSALIERSL